MDAQEAAALLALSERSESQAWAMNELPASVALGVLRGLDDFGFIEVRAVGYWVSNGDRSVKRYGWFSPVHSSEKRGMKCAASWGGWAGIFAWHKNQPERLPFEVRLMERGLAEAGRLRRNPVSQVPEKMPESAGTLETAASPASQAFVAAQKFVEYLAMLAEWARRFNRNAPLYPPGTLGHIFGHDQAELANGSPRAPLDWDEKAYYFAEAFIAWYDLTDLLTPTVRTEARRVYPPGAAPIKLAEGDKAAPVVPAMPASVTSLLTAFRRMELDATPYPTVIEAVADGLGVYFRNAMYANRRHPLEPDTELAINEAKAAATARQVAQGKAAEPFGWREDYDKLMKLETRAAVRTRLGIKTYGDGQDLMMREWKAQDRARCESVLYTLRCDPISFAELRVKLIREFETVRAATGVEGKTDRQDSPPQTSKSTQERLHLDAVARSFRAVGKSVYPGIRAGSFSNHPVDDNAFEAISENDVAILAFLNRTPNLRRKVSDVLPEKGPQDRKAVANRLRKLADRTPPLVDYPKGGRAGVAILPAGVEALNRATAPTPR